MMGTRNHLMDPTITIAAVGDIDIADYLRPRTAASGPMWAFEPCRDLLRADILFGNLECVAFRPPWPEEPPNERESFHLSWPEAMGLVQAGFDVLGLANNHILDYGADRAMETIEFCRSNGIAHVGLGADPAGARRPAVIERRGVKVGFLAYVEDVPGLKRQTDPGPAYICERQIREDIVQLRDRGVDLVVVSLHADMEFADHPAPHRVALSRRLIHAGADILLGHHPHVPQGIERCGRGLIVYSLGDFIFPVAGDPYLEGNSRWTDQSFILRVRAGKRGYLSHEIVPVRIEESGRPVPMTAAQAAPLLARQERISRDLADPAAMERAWVETARRWWRINIEWLANAVREKGPEYAARHFLREFFYEENGPWVRRMVGEVLREMPARTWEQPVPLKRTAGRNGQAVGRRNGDGRAVRANGNGKAAGPDARGGKAGGLNRHLPIARPVSGDESVQAAGE